MIERRQTSIAAPRASWLSVAWCTVVIMIGAQAPSVQAQEQTPTGDVDATYRVAIREGVQALHEGRFAAAHVQLSRAHELRPSARTLRGLGIAELELGEHVAAYQHLSAALTDPRKPLVEPQREEVQRTLAELRTMIGVFRVELSPRNASCLVDGATPAVDPDGRWLLPRGLHTVVVTASGHQPQERKLEVRGGEEDSLAIALEANAPQSLPVASTPAPKTPQQLPATPALPRRPAERPQVWQWVVIGSGAALAITGTALAAVGTRDRAKVEDAQDGARWSSLDGPYDRARVLTPVGWTLAGAGIAGAGVGVWTVLRPDVRERRTTLRVVPRGVQLEGRF